MNRLRNLANCRAIFLTEADEKVFEQLKEDLQIEIGIEAYQKQQRAL